MGERGATHPDQPVGVRMDMHRMAAGKKEDRAELYLLLFIFTCSTSVFSYSYGRCNGNIEHNPQIYSVAIMDYGEGEDSLKTALLLLRLTLSSSHKAQLTRELLGRSLRQSLRCALSKNLYRETTTNPATYRSHPSYQNTPAAPRSSSN